MTTEQQQKIKSDNDALIRQKGYRVNDWLPILDTTAMRPLAEIKGRMAVMNALINISFEAPVYIIREWIQEQGLAQHLSAEETVILDKDNEALSQTELNALSWYLESLWALMWLTGLTPGLDAEAHVGDNQASLLPNLEQGEDNSKIEEITAMRTEEELYTMLDYYYRLHWYCVDERLNGRQARLNEGIVYERRKALEWAFNRSADWDNVEMST